MSESLHSFSDAARNIRLSAAEKASIGASLGKMVRNRGEPRLSVTMNSEMELFTRAKEISLSPAERVQMRESLLKAVGATTLEPVHWMNPFRLFTGAVAALVVVFAGGAGITYAAEDALPGDLLYPVKVHVNEEVIATFTKKTPEQSVYTALWRAERRLKEAEQLASMARLDAEKEATISSNFEVEVKNTVSHVESLIAMNPENAGVAIDVAASLQAHVSVLEQLQTRKNSGSLDTLMKQLREASMQAEEHAIVAIMSPTASAETELALKAASDNADLQIRRADKSIAKAKRSVTKDVSLNLDAAKAAFQAAVDEKDSSKASRLRLARTAIRKAREAALFIDISAEEGTDNGTESDETTRKANAQAAVEANVIKDMAFGAQVRMRMTNKKAKSLGERLESHRINLSPDISIPVETHIDGSKQLVDIARQQMEEGNVTEALETASTALKHVDEAADDLKDIPEVKTEAATATDVEVKVPGL